ncbi:hypothetical protein [Tuwongella immobilis]|uniref:Uncharacterized protein n=1 Tax=Tuwongella immobilis TaxID=692036 RepID=A0A6C2YJR1_9BACT|nr:hypothetical protein [Tuwongella immobilis]VIP01192.1 unnamed protein product [Tuwongella immobilis]VTR97810.1 unnamed protein product [Tuwongella immobilis]
MHRRLLELREPDSRGVVYSRWTLGNGATAMVFSEGDTHTVYVGLTPMARNLLWEPKRVLPFLHGWSVRQIWCVDGWGIVFTGYPEEEVVAKMCQVVTEGREYWGCESQAEPDATATDGS